MADPPAVGLSEWISALRGEIQSAQAQSADEHLRFVTGPIEIELEVVSTWDTAGKTDVRFWVVSAGGTLRHEHQSRQRLKLVLTPEIDGRPVRVDDNLRGRPE
jgi:Trypsin-co-occurring domain 2